MELELLETVIDYTPIIAEHTTAVVNVILFGAFAICGLLVALNLFGGGKS